MKSIWLVACAIAIVANAAARGFTESTVDEVRSRAVANLGTFRAMAETISTSGIQWASEESVRYRRGSRYETAPWKEAALSPSLKQSLPDFIVANQLVSVAAHDGRVNFVMAAEGIVPSGASFGVLVFVPPRRDDCTKIVPKIDIHARGLQCEPLSGSAFFYLHSNRARGRAT
jgi:hypothetical protein